ncbi:MAG: VanW family protein [Candidatus Gracilibacteria bacterium]|jgi:vancomycin resistance protein YoaR|nr:VanW family protein [Candidatus Gracilibacteria bacterium]
MKILKTALTIILFSLLILLIAASFLLAYKKAFHLTYPSNTIVAGLDISGINPPEAKKLFEEKITSFLESSTKFTLKETTIEIKNKELLVEYKIDETLSGIILSDLSGNFIPKLFTEKMKTDIALIVKPENEKILALLEEKFAISDIRAKNASIFFNEEETLDISEELNGFVLNTESLNESIKHSFSNMSPTEIVLKLEEESPKITKADIESLLPEINDKLKNKITLIDPVFSDNWTIKLDDYPKFVSFKTTSDKQVYININREAFFDFVDEEISKWLDRPAEDVNITKQEDGKIEITGKGIDGTEIKRDLFVSLFEKAANAKASSVLIPINPMVPKLIVSKELADLGIKERLGVGHTSYYGSPTNRIHNIKVGASKFNGHLIAPGETFSFNTTLGRVDGSTGYRKELVIKEEGTIPEYGGGLCQVSTTVYRAILFSGLPVVDRRPHSYSVSYYSQILGHGLDATIYLGGQDLKFTNDTNHHILIQTFVDGNYELYITFYGTSDGRTVEMDGPYLSNYHSPGPTQLITTNTLAPGERKQVEKSHTGFNAVWYRYITKANGDKIKETITSAYRAIPAKILVGAQD